MTTFLWIAFFVSGLARAVMCWCIGLQGWRAAESLAEQCDRLEAENRKLRAEVELRKALARGQLACRDVRTLVLNRN